MNIRCVLLGHRWLGRGWEVNKTNENVPTGIFRHLWQCARCSKVDYTDELPDDLQARYDGYRAKYGDFSSVVDDEYSAPKPTGRLNTGNPNV